MYGRLMESKATFPRKTSLRIFLLSSILTWYQSAVLDFWSVRIIFSLGFVGFSWSAHSGFHLGGVLMFSASSAVLALISSAFFGCGFRQFIILGVWSIMSSNKLEAFSIQFTGKNYSAW